MKSWENGIRFEEQAIFLTYEYVYKTLISVVNWLKGGE